MDEERTSGFYQSPPQRIYFSTSEDAHLNVQLSTNPNGRARALYNVEASRELPQQVVRLRSTQDSHIDSSLDDGLMSVK